MNLSTPFIARPVATTLLTAAVALAGLVAFNFLPISPLPQIEFPTISVGAALPGTAIGADPDLTSPVVVLTVRQAKGLEFDCVLIVEPGMLLAASPRGLNDLYVALTRTTQRVGVVHAGDLPDVLSRLAPAASPARVG